MEFIMKNQEINKLERELNKIVKIRKEIESIKKYVENNIEKEPEGIRHLYKDMKELLSEKDFNDYIKVMFDTLYLHPLLK
jgi:vacuolar-type H+-ATPase subunit I/STV1